MATVSFIRVQAYTTPETALPNYIDEYDVPTPNAAPLAITVDRNGIVWFTESNASKLARFDPNTGNFTEYKVPGVGDMWGITIDASGDVWLTQYSLKGSVSPGGVIEPGGSGNLVRFNPNTGNFTVIPVPTTGAFPFRVITDSGGRVWFTELLGDQIGCYDPSTGKMQVYPVPAEYAGPAELTFDSHGMLWFTEAYNESVARFDPQTDTFMEYHFYSIDPNQYVGSPVGIAVTSDGIVWVADHGGNWLVEFNATSQQILKYPTHFPPPNVYPISIPNDLILGPQGRIWFAEHGGNSLGMLDPQAGRMVEYAIPTGPISTVLWLAMAPNQDIWFTEWSADKIGVLHTSLPVPLTVTASESSLGIRSGGQATVSLALSSKEASGVSGTFVYAWPSYNVGDVNVTFTQQNGTVSAQTSVSTQANVQVSKNVPPDHYMLGLGFDAGNVTVWTMVPTQVSAQTSITGLIVNNPWLPVGVIVIGLLVVLASERHIRSAKKRKSVF